MSSPTTNTDNSTHKSKATEWFSVRNIVAIGIGAAVFFVLATYVNVPTGIPNTNFKIAEGWSGLLTIIFGPVVGFFLVLIGNIISGLIAGSFWWSWIIADAIYALLIGLPYSKIKIEDEPFTGKKIVLFNITQIVAGLISWVLIAPIGDVLIYSEPASKVFLQGVVAWIANSITVGIISTLLLVAYNKSRAKAGSLQQEN